MSNSGFSRRDFIAAAGISLMGTGLLEAKVPQEPDVTPPKLPIPGPAPRRTGFAIVGLGMLALEQVLPAFSLTQRCRPVALVSGKPDKAKKVAEHYGLDERNIYDYDSYDKLKENPDVEVVYVILPNSLHAEFTIRALNAGKHVLCEKPMATTPEQCQQMIDAAKKNSRKLMIAYRLRYEPYNQAVIEMCRKQAYGPIKYIEAINAQQQPNEPNYRLVKSLGGGALFDVGIYCLNATRYITGEEPVAVTGKMYSTPSDPRFREVDESTMFRCDFANGVSAQCFSSFGAYRNNRFRVVCTDGYIELDPAFQYTGQRLIVGKGNEREQIELPHVNHFAAEMDHLAECIQENKNVRTPGEEGLADIRAISAIIKANETRGIVTL